MMLSRARFLSSALAMNHGAQAVSVATNISSRAFEYSYQRLYDSRSMGESFQILRPSSMRVSSRRFCSCGLISSQYFSRIIPDSLLSG